MLNIKILEFSEKTHFAIKFSSGLLILEEVPKLTIKIC